MGLGCGIKGVVLRRIGQIRASLGEMVLICYWYWGYTRDGLDSGYRVYNRVLEFIGFRVLGLVIIICAANSTGLLFWIITGVRSLALYIHMPREWGLDPQSPLQE